MIPAISHDQHPIVVLVPDYPPESLIHRLNGFPLILLLPSWHIYRMQILLVRSSLLIIEEGLLKNDPRLTQVPIRYPHGDDTPAIIIIETDALGDLPAEDTQEDCTCRLKWHLFYLKFVALHFCLK